MSVRSWFERSMRRFRARASTGSMSGSRMAIGALLDDIAAGRKYMKVYRQMKMYNDADTNPVLYGAK